MSVLTVAVAKVHLNIPAATTTHDAELTDIIAAAEAAIGQRVGPLEPTATTSRVRGHSDSLTLPETPVISLTSVTPVGGTALTVGDLELDTKSGVVRYLNDAGSFTSARYDVVYSAGRASVPADLMLAVKELVRHLWETQRGGTRRPGSGLDQSPVPGSAYMFPHRVSELLAPHAQEFGFA